MPENSEQPTENRALSGVSSENNPASSENLTRTEGDIETKEVSREHVLAGNNVAQTEGEETPRLIMRLISHPKSPFIFVGLFALLLVYWAHAKNYISVPLPGLAPRVVVFDPVKFMNSQRAAASLFSLQPNGDAAFAITQVAKQAENVILEEARGAVILVKQAVVVPTGVEDITDKVLRRFDLPTDVPTINAGLPDSMLNVAPTDYAFSPEEASDNYKEELLRRRASVAEKISSESAQKGAVP